MSPSPDRSPSEPMPWWVQTSPPQTGPTDLPPAPVPAARGATRLGPWPVVAGLACGLVLLCGLIALAHAIRRPQPADILTALEVPQPEPDRPAAARGSTTQATPLPPAETLSASPVREVSPASARRARARLLRPPPRPTPADRAEQLPAPAVEIPRVLPVAALRRRDTASEEQHRRTLAEAPEVGLGASANAVLRSYDAHLRASQSLAEPPPPSVSPLLDLRPDLAALPLREGLKIRLTPRATVNLELLSRKLRIYLSGVAAVGPQHRQLAMKLLGLVLEQESRTKDRPEWLHPDAVPTLVQLLMAEDAELRRLLVDLLARVEGRKATVALAQRAVFDLDAGVRAAAVRELEERSRQDYLPVLLAALRYPWSPAADHAAEALATLRARESVPALIGLLPLRDPALPWRRGEHLMVREVVRINHLNNCLLCHPPVQARTEPCQGVDPVITRPALMTLQLAQQALSPTAGAHDYAHQTSSTLQQVRSQVRASLSNNLNTLIPVNLPVTLRGDITFLRQDFSVKLPVKPPAGLPGLAGFPALPPAAPGAASSLPPVRFDYVVQTRTLSLEEARRFLRASRRERRDPAAYPQREAVLFALRELTGEDAGTNTAAWRRRFPYADVDVQAGKLVDTLAAAADLERDRLLGNLRAGPGPLHTRALAWAVYRLRGPAREQARSALVNRLARFDPRELRSALRADLPEIREAAIRACLRHKELVPALIPLLEDSEPLVARQARQALAELTDHSFERPSEWLVWWHGRDTAVAAR